MDDQWLISRCVEGKTAYWQVLVVRYRQQLFDRVSRRLKDPDAAWEVVDAAFYHLRGSLATLEQPVRPQNSDGFFFSRLIRSAAESFIRKSRGEEA